MSEPITLFDQHHPEYTADLCVKCNICTAACPVAPVTDLFPGPKTVGPQAQRFRMNGERGGDSPDKSVDYCSARLGIGSRRS
jgi:glycerol-3-phosphate dehydrogenase subunit C